MEWHRPAALCAPLPEPAPESPGSQEPARVWERSPTASSVRNSLPFQTVVCVVDLDDSATNAVGPRMRLGRCIRALLSVSVQNWSYFPNTPPETIKAMALELSISMGVTLSAGKIITCPAKLYD